jgi:hypothetical protein
MIMESIKTELNRNGNKRGMHPNSQNNLRPGPGRPRNELSLTNLAREELKKSCPYAPDKTWLQYLVERWLGHSVDNVTYFRELIERIEGKVLQPIGGENGEPIRYEINVKDAETKQFTDRIIKGDPVVSNISLS